MLGRLLTVAALAAFGWREVVALPQASVNSNNTSPTTHIVYVGRGDHDFSPSVTVANVGDTISELHIPLWIWS